MGDLVISLVLQKFNALPPDLGATPARVLVTSFDESTLKGTFEVASRLREAGIPTAVYPQSSKLSIQFKYADRMDFPVCLVIGPSELEQGTVTVKDLRRGDQQTIPQTGLVDNVRNLLGSEP
jgi:histidyl-tRNA synthetase